MAEGWGSKPPLLICATLRLLHPRERQTAVLLDRPDCISPNHGSPKPDENNEAHDRFAPKDRWGIFFYAGFLFVEPMVEGLQRCGRDVTPDSFVKAMDTLKDFQGIGPKITYGPNQRQRSRSFFLPKCVEGGELVRISDWMTSDIDVQEVIKRLRK